MSAEWQECHPVAEVVHGLERERHGDTAADHKADQSRVALDEECARNAKGKGDSDKACSSPLEAHVGSAEGEMVVKAAMRTMTDGTTTKAIGKRVISVSSIAPMVRSDRHRRSRSFSRRIVGVITGDQGVFTVRRLAPRLFIRRRYGVGARGQ